MSFCTYAKFHGTPIALFRPWYAIQSHLKVHQCVFKLRVSSNRVADLLQNLSQSQFLIKISYTIHISCVLIQLNNKLKSTQWLLIGP